MMSESCAVRHLITVGLSVVTFGSALADDVRDFAPNRPSRSDSPYTVPQDLVQIETDLVNYTHTGQVLQALDPMIIYGVSHVVDAEISFGGFLTQRTGGARSEGFGDVTVRAKLNLLGDDGGALTIAISPYVKIPTASPPIGNGQVEGGVNMPFLFALPYGIGLTVDPEAAVLKSALTNAKQVSFTGVINIGRNVVGNLSAFVELYGQAYTDHATSGPNLTFDYGLAYLLTKTIQLDIGANVGLNRSTPSLNIYTGAAFRF